MNRKRLVHGLLLGVLIGFPLNAATVSFLVIEAGLPQRAAASQFTSNWEDGLLDVFFEQGHIVSNAPIMRLPDKPSEALPNEAEGDFAAALEGGVEYFIIALLDYPSPISSTEIARPHNVSLLLFSTMPRALLYEQHYTDSTFRSAREEYDNVKKAVSGLLPHLDGR